MAKLRIIKVNQSNLDIALEHDIWGRKKMGYKDWEKGDRNGATTLAGRF
jgi:hypothetical protein